MYALVESGSVTKLFPYPKGFELNGNQYPQDIFYKWSRDEKEAIGIYEVITDSSNKKRWELVHQYKWILFFCRQSSY